MVTSSLRSRLWPHLSARPRALAFFISGLFLQLHWCNQSSMLIFVLSIIARLILFCLKHAVFVITNSKTVRLGARFLH